MNDVPNHTKRHHLGVNGRGQVPDRQILVFNYLCNPQLCLSRKNTIILSRRGTLELRVHWLILVLLVSILAHKAFSRCDIMISPHDVMSFCNDMVMLYNISAQWTFPYDLHSWSKCYHGHHPHMNNSCQAIDICLMQPINCMLLTCHASVERLLPYWPEN